MNAKIDNFVFCGVGAAGSNTFLHLLYAFPTSNFTLVDFDSVETRNIEAGTQPYAKMDINRPKTQAMQRISVALKNKKVLVSNKKIQSEKDIQDIVNDPSKTVILDCFDNAESRNIFLKLDKKYNVIHIGFSANLSGEAVWDNVFTKMSSSKTDAAVDVCQMTLARPFIFTLTSLAAMIIMEFVETGKKTNLYFDRYFNIKKY